MLRKSRLGLLLLFIVAIPFLLLSTGSGRADDRDDQDRDRANGPVKLLKTIPVPVSPLNSTAGAMYSFDISFVDQATGGYFLADRSNKAVDVVNANTGTFVTQIFPNNGHGPFAGFTACVGVPGAGPNDCAGPNGVVAAFPWLFVTDAPSRVLTFDLRTNPPTTVSEVTTKAGEPTRADELAYDPRDGLILAINNAAAPPFATLIRVNKATGALTVVKTIDLDAANGVDAQNGAEQPIWNPNTGKFYLSIPQIGPNVANGGVIRISTSGNVETTFPVEHCSPAGLSLGPDNQALIGCNAVFDTAGKVWDPNGAVSAAPKDVIINLVSGRTTNVPGVGAGDEVWFNPGDGKYYATGSGSPLRPLPAATAKGSTPLGVIDAEDQKLVQLVPTYNVPAGAGHPAGTSHSVAAFARNNHVFVPLPANNSFPNCLTGCIAVLGRSPADDD